ncbi:MAG: hypothetical protein U0T82_13060 [Bacteroidales bacterium]
MRISNLFKGLLLSFSLSMLLLTLFFGNLFPVFNKVYFSRNGDGLMMYTNMIYHVKYSEGYLRCNSMNYPFGEHVFFTNNQPLISNSIKFLANHGMDLSGSMIGIMNALMVFSILIAALLLFLILFELGVGWWLAALAAAGIAFLSPQLDRFGGHFTLSYVFSIPLYIYLLLRFFKKPGWFITLLIAATAFISALTHFYLFGFFALIALFFYAGYALAGRKIWKGKYIWTLHLLVQFVIPFLLLQGMYLADSVTDRPEYPWGFLVYRAYPQSILLPLTLPYGQFLKHFIPTGYIEWEGYGFVGSVAAIFTFILVGFLFIRIFRRQFKRIPDVTGDLRLNILFWASVAALLYSFGIPYILGMEWLIDYIGPLRQMRGIARFSWIFYFVINITVFYWLWNNMKTKAGRLIPTFLVVLALIWLYTDSYLWARHRGEMLANHIPEMQDAGNHSEGNQWINRVDISAYQAILPVPYFHVGSENIWIEKGCDILAKSVISCMQTGLPSMGVMLSRTSISQTCDNLSLLLEPTANGIRGMKFPSQKPLLLLAARCDEVNRNERRLIEQAHWIDSTQSFDIYSLPVSAFRDIYLSDAAAAKEEMLTRQLTHNGVIATSDKLNRTVIEDFDSLPSASAYSGKGCFTGKTRQYNLVFYDSLPLADTSLSYTGSLWLGHFRTDLMPRSTLIMIQTDSTGKELFYDSWTVFRQLEAIDGDWARIEWKFKLRDPALRIKVFLNNDLIRHGEILVDELMIRPSDTDVYRLTDRGIMKNNRFYFSSDLSSF